VKVGKAMPGQGPFRCLLDINDKEKIMSSRKLLKTVVVLVAIIFTSISPMFANGGTESETAAVTRDGKYGGTLRFGMFNVLPNPGYMPEVTSNGPLVYVYAAYESLIKYDEKGNVIPSLATEWSTDPSEPSITWTLRQGVRFSDGEPFNAAAVKRNIEEYQSVGRNETQNIDSIEVVDDYTVKLMLKSWNSSTLEGMGFYVFYASPKALEDVDALRSTSAGTGPFKVTEFENNVKVRYVKNNYYWQEGKPYLDGINFDIIQENQTIALAFQNGEYDAILIEDLIAGQQLMNSGLYDMEENKSGRGLVGTGLIPNSADPDSPFYDVKVRQAMCYAIDAEAIVKTFGYGLLDSTNQWAAPGAKTYSPNVKGYPYNPEKAKQLLKEAGYPNGFDTVINTPPQTKDMFTAAANMLTESGIRTTVNLVDDPTIFNLFSSTWEGIMGHYHSISPDLGLFMGRHLDPEAPFYAGGIQHPQEMLDLLQKIRVASTDKEKVALEWKMQDLAYDKYALYGQPLYIQKPFVFKVKNLHDTRINIDHVYTWDPASAWFE